MADESVLKWKLNKKQIQEMLMFLPNFLINPIEGMKKEIQWNWHTILFLHLVLGASTGFLSGLLSQNILVTVGNTFFFPLSAVLTNFAAAGIFYLYFQKVFDKTLDFKEIYLVIIIANIPFLILRTFSTLQIPIGIVGLAFTAFLLPVGFVEHFQLPKKRIVKTMGLLYGAYFCLWIVYTIMSSHQVMTINESLRPKTLDNLERQLEGDTD